MRITPEIVAARLGCTPEQTRRQYRRNADQLRAMRDRALETGQKVNGYTADQLRDMAVKMENAGEPCEVCDHVCDDDCRSNGCAVRFEDHSCAS